MAKKHYQLLILGSGPAGCTAAIYAGRAELSFAILTGREQGGQLITTPKISNWPGEPNDIPGATLMEKMLTQVQNFSNNVISDNINQVDLTKRPFYLKGDEAEYTCDALIIATGASAKFLGLASEQKYLGKGVSTCAICDGFFYKNKEVAVIGGGNTAIEEALYLAKIAKKVTIIHRRTSLRAEQILIDQLQKNHNITWELNSTVNEILGDDQGVNELLIKNVNTSIVRKISIDGVFIAIGYKPNTDIFSGQLILEKGYIKTGFQSIAATSIPGVFAAGDVVANNYHQAIVAAGSGCVAALDAKNFLATLNSERMRL